MEHEPEVGETHFPCHHRPAGGDHAGGHADAAAGGMIRAGRAGAQEGCSGAAVLTDFDAADIISSKKKRTPEIGIRLH